MAIYISVACGGKGQGLLWGGRAKRERKRVGKK
jgi:hypothetical protein